MHLQKRTVNRSEGRPAVWSGVWSGTWRVISRPFQLMLLGLILLASLAGGLFVGGKLPFQGQTTGKHVVTLAARQQANAPAPFLHRPYYGNRTISSRTVSFVDHDRPWYDYDGVFVRYDGQKWTGVSIGSCTGGVNCYDGHNGYDLNLWYEPVLSAAAGTVIRAGWYDPTNHQSALGLWAAVDHGNGFVTAYGHLSALTVAVGDTVGTQWQLGTSGTTGSSTGPHLHMATYYLPYWNATDPFGWTGSYADPNVVPDYYLWVNNPGTASTIPLLSSNGSAIYPGATLVDDGGPGWSSTGSWSVATSATDINGDLHWTASSSGTATATATWQPKLSQDGYYEVGVFVDDNHASSGWAPYTIYSDDPNHPGTEIQHTVNLDEEHIGSFQGPYGWENTGPQWVGLGTYYFSASMNGRVVLSNATGENGTQLAADGVEFAPVASMPGQTPPVYGFAVSGDDTPAAMLPNSTAKVDLTLQNSGNFTWPASGTAAVTLIYRWLNAQNQVILTGSSTALPQDVKPGGSVSLSVSVQTPAVSVGTYTLQWDMVQGQTVFSQQGAKPRNDSVEIAAYAASIATSGLPTNLPPGATVQVQVSAKNTGAQTWAATGSGQVIAGYYWLNSAGQPVDASIAGPSSTGTLAADVAPGASTTVSLTLHTPALAGTYRLVYDFQQQGTWFSSQGATPLTLNMTITPSLPATYYFAEGYTGTGTTEYLSLINPALTPVSITITYLFQSGAPLTRTYTVAAQGESVLNINHEVGANKTVGMMVQGNQPFAAERTMYTHKDTFVAATDSPGIVSLASNWYFADGHTTPGWNTLLSVLNPSAQPVTLTVSGLSNSSGGLRPRNSSNNYTIAARARATIVLNTVFPNRQFGLAISASAPVAVEEPMYLASGSQRGGSVLAGVSAPQQTWYFGAGNTTAGFNEHLILTDPNAQPVSAQVRYLLASGQVVTQNVSIVAQGRLDISVNSVVRSALHAIMITSSAPIVAAREAFFTTQFGTLGLVTGSTAVTGSAATHNAWYVAQGDSSAGHVESLALANFASSATQIQVVYYQANGAPTVKTYTLAANTCMTLNLANEAGTGMLVGMAIYSTQPVVVEQTMFFNLNGASGGYASMGYGQ